jgi:hypothetical protein
LIVEGMLKVRPGATVKVVALDDKKTSGESQESQPAPAVSK